MRRLLYYSLLFASLYAQESGEKVYQDYCASCHVKFVPADSLMKNFFEQENRLLSLKAPSINQLAFRLKQKIGDKQGDREFHLMEVTDFIIEYVNHPMREKSVCLPEVLRHFETMPSMEGEIDEGSLALVAEWIYWSDIPEEKTRFEGDE